MPSLSHDEVLNEQLQDADFAAMYLTAAIEDGDKAVILVHLNRVIKARAGMAELASVTGRERGSLYKSFGENGNPLLETFMAALELCDLELRVVSKDSAQQVA
jgi:probable addiction module antidote protein